MSGAMRIERRGLEEYLVGGPVEVNDCDATHDGERCNVHFNGQHISTSRPDADGAEYILARWPIEEAASTGSPAPSRSVEEIAQAVTDAQDYLADVGAASPVSPVSLARAALFRAMGAIERDRVERQSAQHRDLAGRIRNVVSSYLPAPHVTTDADGRTLWEGVKTKPDGRGLRLSLYWTKSDALQARDEAVARMCDQLHSVILKPHEETR